MKPLYWRKTSFYKEILALPNVELIHPSFSPDEIIKKSSLVISITGTSALQAAFYEKPSIVLAHTIYKEFHPSIRRVKNLEELPNAIRSALKTKVDVMDLNRYIEIIEKESFIYVRYKSSDRYRTLNEFYRYTTTSYRKNTRAGVQLQYHFNQGLGLFVKEYQQGLVNIEIGHAFDVSDYLNAERKTSYVKCGVYWDHDTARFSTKFEVEHFQQISEIIENNLTRNQYMFVIIVPVNNGISLNLNFEMEDYLNKDQNDASSITFAIGWGGKLKWTL